MQSFTFLIIYLFINILTISNSLPCNETVCQLPDCFCAGTTIPGQIAPANTPQFVLLNFLDSVNTFNIDYYRNSLKNRTNPNGCSISSSFSIPHPYTNYEFIHELHAEGHEIVMNSISHTFHNLSLETFNLEYTDQKLLVSKFAKIPKSDIKGMRTVLSNRIVDNQLQMMENNFLFDLSCSIFEQNVTNGWWPFTTEFSQSHSCIESSVKSYSDIWVIPINKLEDQSGNPCSLVDTCVNIPNTSDDLLNWMIREFNKKYTDNKAPFEFYFHSAWFAAEEIRYQAFNRFLDYLGTLNDVFIVSGSQLIEWIKNPKTVGEMMTLPITCHKTYEPNCIPLTCLLLTSENHERYFTHCDTKCPKSLPELGNPLGEN